MVKKKSSGARNRAAGHAWELSCIKMLKSSVGLSAAVSSRSANKRRDDAKVDIVNWDESVFGRLPLDIQCKNTCTKADYATLIKEIEECNPHSTSTPIVFHKQTFREDGKEIFRPVGEYAILKLAPFIKIFNRNLLFLELKEFFEANYQDFPDHLKESLKLRFNQEDLDE